MLDKNQINNELQFNYFLILRDLGVVKESLEAEWELVNNNILNIKSRE